MAEKNNVFIFSQTDVSKYVQKKMGLSYLNWAFVVDTLKTNDPTSNYSVKQFPEINLKTGQLTGRKVNYFAGMNGNDSYVEVTVTFRGQSQTEDLPCYDFKGNAVRCPDAMLVNKTIKRCYVKAAAILTGLGISLYINGYSGGRSNENYRNYRSNYSSRNSSYSSQRPVRSSGNSSSQPQNRPTTGASSKQIKFIQSLLSHKDGSSNPKLYKSFANHRNDMVEYLGTIAKQTGGTTKQIASYAIKHLSKLPDKQKKQKLDGNHAYTTA